ncbi:hypothetical protein Q3G72_032837 [Acer saccharum]|nr:hypothetical protein Q3G72_032837 [Acer saccharum]
MLSLIKDFTILHQFLKLQLCRSMMSPQVNVRVATLSFMVMQVGSFRESARLYGLLDSDNTLEECLQEASIYQMPYTLRRLFATLLVYCRPANLRNLWEKYEVSISEDYHRSGLNFSDARLKVLEHIRFVVKSMGNNINDYHLVDYDIILNEDERCIKEINDELGITVSESDLSLKLSLTFKQKCAYDRILEKVFMQQSTSFFIDGPGGTGKTYLYKAILATLRSKGMIALATTSSGVAASVLPGDRTTHSRFNTILCFFKRPKLREFLEFCFRNFKVAVWSSKEMKNLTPVLDVLMDKDIQDKLLFTWDRSKCTKTKYCTSKTSTKPLVLKELRKCWDDEVVKGKNNEFNTMLLDDSPYKALLDPGTRIQATIFDKNIRAFEDTLIVFKKYHITNANVRPILSDHRVVNNEYQWIIDGGTMVEEIEKKDIVGTSKNTPEFSFVPFSRLDNYIDSFDQVDIIALAIDVQPVRCAAILNHIATKPVIVAMRLKVVSYKNLSLRTKASTCIMIDPDMPETYALRTWRDENKLYLKSTLAEKECLTSSQASTIPINQPTVLISTLQISAEMDGWVDIESLVNISNSKEYIIRIKSWKQKYAGEENVKHNIIQLFNSSEIN